MSLPSPRRREACLHFIESGFDLQETITWFLKEFRSQPAVLKASDPQRLAKNTVTMGGTGSQQELNFIAFQDAVRVFIDQSMDKKAVAKDVEIRSLEETVDRLQRELTTKEQRLDTEHADNKALQRELNELRERAHESEKKLIQSPA